MIANQYHVKKVYMGNFPHGSDIYESISSFIKEKEIRLGSINLIGAAQRAVLGYYNKESAVYEELEIGEQTEIVSCTGNISVLDGRPMAHVHITLADTSGNCRAGHLLPGTLVFVSEFVITEYEGPELIRRRDPELGVPLWVQD